MSYHMEQKLPIEDKQLLSESLKEMGYELEEHEQPMKIRGYRSEMLATPCELILRREKIGKGADIGFHRQADGMFTLVSDDYANKDMKEFTGALKRGYQELKAIRAAKAKGLRVLSRGKWIEQGGRKWLQLKVARAGYVTR